LIYPVLAPLPFTAVVDITISFPIEAPEDPLDTPIKIEFDPLVKLAPALSPIAILLLPVKLPKRVLTPITVFSVPVVRAVNANRPIAVF
jgi:hypothetical protein